MDRIKIISLDHLKNANEIVKWMANSPQRASNYVDSATKILAKEEDSHSAWETFLIAAFMGFEDLGFRNSDAVELVARGLENLGVKVTVPPISPSR